MGASSRPNRDDDGDEDDVTTADSSHDASGAEDDDEEMDEKNENAEPHARGDAMTNRADQDSEEASEERQKAGNMGGKGMKATEPKIQGNELSERDIEENPADKAIHGRGSPPAGERRVPISGSHQGPGGADHGEPRHFTNLGHGEREATISGAHQGNHGGGNKGGMAGEGFEAGGSISKERARGPSGTKR
jgi:hypothetical protein